MSGKDREEGKCKVCRVIKDIGTLNICLRQRLLFQFSAVFYGCTVIRPRDDAAKAIPG
jgi:hypothetical protein